MDAREERPGSVRLLEGNAEAMQRVRRDLGEVPARYMVTDGGFTVLAESGGKLIGMVSVRWGVLPPPFAPLREGYIDVIEVAERHRRRGIGRRLVEESLRRMKAEGAVQARSWSSSDRDAALRMWKALGFSLCPVTHGMWGTQVSGCFVARRID